LEWAFDGGIRSLEAAGYKLGDDLVDVKAAECFKNGLFSSFAQTQSAVGLLFIELEKKRRELSEEIKRLRSDRNPSLKDTQEQLEAVENRQLILRRLMDGILWILLSKPWIANHLVFKKHVSHPDPDELMKVLAIAWGLNQEAKRQIHLVSDLTTISQIGDIIRIRWDENGVYVRLHEIKSGQMNDKLSDLIESRGGILSEEDLEEVETKLGCAAKAQAYRIIRQRERFRQFQANFQFEPLQTALHEDKLQQALTKAKVPSVRTYLLDLPDLVDDAKDPSNPFGMSFLGIDGCLWLVALSEKGLAKLGEVRNLHHWLFSH
jgi:hypothetical protein